MAFNFIEIRLENPRLFRPIRRIVQPFPVNEIIGRAADGERFGRIFRQGRINLRIVDKDEPPVCRIAHAGVIEIAQLYGIV